jgi:hypothetical protein
MNIMAEGATSHAEKRRGWLAFSVLPHPVFLWLSKHTLFLFSGSKISFSFYPFVATQNLINLKQMQQPTLATNIGQPGH